MTYYKVHEHQLVFPGTHMPIWWVNFLPKGNVIESRYYAKVIASELDISHRPRSSLYFASRYYTFLPRLLGILTYQQLAFYPQPCRIHHHPRICSSSAQPLQTIRFSTIRWRINIMTTSWRSASTFPRQIPEVQRYAKNICRIPSCDQVVGGIETKELRLNSGIIYIFL